MGGYRLEYRPGDFVYLLKGKRGLKIGKTCNLESRLKTLRQQDKTIVPLFVVHGYTDLEKELHARFAVLRQYTLPEGWNGRGVASDWFNYEGEIIEWFKVNGISMDEYRRHWLVERRKLLLRELYEVDCELQAMQPEWVIKNKAS